VHSQHLNGQYPKQRQTLLLLLSQGLLRPHPT
jgi:hypothetical protein